MKCVKTGLTFRTSQSPEIFHADLHYCEGLDLLMILGVGREADPSEREPDLALRPCKDYYLVDKMSDPLFQHLIAEYQRLEVQHDMSRKGLPIVIVDARFYIPTYPRATRIMGIHL
jgi:hypothetical protein